MRQVNQHPTAKTPEAYACNVHCSSSVRIFRGELGVLIIMGRSNRDGRNMDEESTSSGRLTIVYLLREGFHSPLHTHTGTTLYLLRRYAHHISLASEEIRNTVHVLKAAVILFLLFYRFSSVFRRWLTQRVAKHSFPFRKLLPFLSAFEKFAHFSRFSSFFGNAVKERALSCTY